MEQKIDTLSGHKKRRVTRSEAFGTVNINEKGKQTIEKQEYKAAST